MSQVPEQLASRVLPLLPLNSGVVLPGMVVTLMLETDDARAAVSAARGQGDLLVLVPKVGARYAAVGTVSKIEDTGRLQNGLEALVIRGLHRATIGTGVAGTGDATWVGYESHPDPAIDSPETTARTKELAKEYRAIIENIVEARGVPQVAEYIRGIT